MKSKLAILFPGIGYTHDKPLMYYSRKMVIDKGYDTICIEYANLPEKVKGDKEKMKQALIVAYEQSCEQLKGIDFSKYEDILIIGKSLGTVVASKYHEEHLQSARLIIYTPVEATFNFSIGSAISFIGDNDPWSDLKIVKELAEKADVPLYIYAECNHSLEVSGDVIKNLEILSDVMSKTEDFIEKRFKI